MITQSVLVRCAKAMQKAGIRDWTMTARPDGSLEIAAGKAESALTGPDPDELLK